MISRVLNCRALSVVGVLSVGLSGCALGPAYQRPAIDIPAHFHAASERQSGWKSASPADHLPRGEWWALYQDAELNALIARQAQNSPTVAAAEAAFRQARALVSASKAAFFPSLDASGARTRSGDTGGSSNAIDTRVNARWELDVWGKLRRQLEADNASLSASEADLAAVRLSQQAALVQNYFELRVLDAQKRLLDATLEAYRRSLKLSENQYQAGLVPRSDVTQARVQLKNTEAQRLDLNQQRAALEHAIAVLVGSAPGSVTLAEREGIPPLPPIPPTLPSALLERRPDVAAAERQVMAANAEIGVARSAWFPEVSLSASGGYRGTQWGGLLSAPNQVWSLGPSIALNLFDAGRIRAQVEQAEARHAETVARYRQTVLDALREVEDSLVQLSVYAQEAAVRQDALAAARESLRLIENQYRAGTVDYLRVASAQTAALSSERTVLELTGAQLATSVRLMAGMGGSWLTADRPAPAMPRAEHPE